MRDAAEKGRAVKIPMPGEKNPAAKLTWPQVEEIRRRSVWGETRAQLAREFGVTKSMISKIRSGDNWKYPPE